jgi:hypothetical protein
MVREYRDRFPGKAVICSLDRADGWAVLAAGGSVPNLPATTDARLLAAAAAMRPYEPKSGLTERQWALAEPGRSYLVYSATGEPIRLDLSADSAAYTAHRVNPRTGQCGETGDEVSGGRVVEFAPPGAGAWVLWLTHAPGQ